MDLKVRMIIMCTLKRESQDFADRLRRLPISRLRELVDYTEHSYYRPTQPRTYGLCFTRLPAITHCQMFMRHTVSCRLVLYFYSVAADNWKTTDWNPYHREFSMVSRVLTQCKYLNVLTQCKDLNCLLWS